MGVITRVAGTGTSGNTGNDGPATDAQLNNPAGVAVTSDGGFLIADFGNHMVRKVSAVGVITRVAGAVRPGNSGDGGRASFAQLAWPEGLAVTGDGGFLVADLGNHVIRTVSPDGLITRAAGIGRPGDAGDDGPATDARLNKPAGLAVTVDGGFLIADSGSHVVRHVSAAGVIIRVAGTGTAGNTGDGGPATEAELRSPVGVAVTADGGFLITDNAGHVVRKVSPDGVITRVAGTGTPENTGDGGPALDAQLRAPAGVAVTGDGGFVIADYAGHVVRKVSADGMIFRVAGTGLPGNTGDGGPATDAQLNHPNWVAARSDGGFLIADFGNHVVRAVAAS